MRDVRPLIAALGNPNVQAFWQMVRYCEGTQGVDGYRVMFGGGHLAGLDGIPGTLDDFADHPRTRITRTMKGKVYTSQAAGAGQFMPPTWDEMAALYGLTDFSPRNQDIAYVGLLIRRKALDDVIAGRFEQAVFKCRLEWASLPGSPYGQPIKTIEACQREYERWGGAYAPAGEQLTITGLDAPQIEVANAPKPTDTVELPVDIDTLNQEQAMPIPAFVAAALPSILAAIPELAKMFSSGSATSERNIKAAETVIAIAKEAVGARNEQELVETMASDPEAVKAVQAAVKANWFDVQQVGGGIKAAQEANLRVQGDRSFFFNPAVWISALLLIFPTMLLVDVFYVHPGAEYYSENIRTQIVTAVLAVIMMVGAYWLGTTASSKQKDDTMNKMVGGS